MICEVDCDNPKFDALCKIADKVLKPTAIKWCTGGILRGRYTPEDLMHDIHVRLMKTIVTGFLRNNRSGGEINNDPDGFNSWLFEVAHNLIFDKTKKTSKVRMSNTKPLIKKCIILTRISMKKRKFDSKHSQKHSILFLTATEKFTSL